jgi:hypothetical protein
MNNLELFNKEAQKYSLQESKSKNLQEVFLPILDNLVEYEGEYKEI